LRLLHCAGDAAARALQPLAQQHVTAGSCLSSVYYDNPATFRRDLLPATDEMRGALNIVSETPCPPVL